MEGVGMTKIILILTWFLHGVDGGAHTNLTRIEFATMKECQWAADRFREDAKRLDAVSRIHVQVSAICVQS
jgi:hypothetical protein